MTGTGQVCGALYQAARLLVLFNVDGVEDVVQLVLLAPIFRVFELLKGFAGDKTTRAQVAPVSSQSLANEAIEVVFCAYSIVSSSWLADFAPLAGV